MCLKRYTFLIILTSDGALRLTKHLHPHYFTLYPVSPSEATVIPTLQMRRIQIREANDPLGGTQLTSGVTGTQIRPSSSKPHTLSLTSQPVLDRVLVFLELMPPNASLVSAPLIFSSARSSGDPSLQLQMRLSLAGRPPRPPSGVCI